jgi:streptogramin lyase/tRNA A-37 threonylcarbamoyl transferase component Bud32
VTYQVNDLAAGSLVAGYRIDRVIGRGARSVVYLAYDPRLKRRVALKMLLPAAGRGDEFRRRFLAESQLAASLDHANAVPIYEAGEAEGRLFIAMRYVEGADLRRLLANGPLEPARSIAIAEQVARVLDAAHALGLVHRDVKPSNVLLDGTGHAYLADFGVTQRIGTSDPEDDVFVGSIDYVAPEQIRGGQVEGRADQYALACLLCECLSGRPPFAADSAAAVLFAHLNDRPPSLPGLEGVLLRALAKSPSERYPTCAAFVEDAGRELGLARPRRRAAALLVAAAVVLAAGAAAGAIVLSRDGPTHLARTGKDRLVMLDPASGRVRPTSAVGQRLTAVAAFGRGAWVADAAAATLLHVDGRGRVIGTEQARGEPNDLAVSQRDVFAANDDNGTVAAFDARSGDLQTIVHVSNPGVQAVCDVALASTTGWATDCADSRIIRFDALTGRLLRSVELPPPHGDELDQDRIFSDLAVGHGAVWVAGDALDPTLYRVNLSGRGLTRIRVPAGATAVAADRGSVWLASQLDDAVLRIDPSTSRVVSRIRVGRDPLALAFGDGSVWVASGVDRTIARIDPRRGSVVRTFRIDSRPVAISVGNGAVWIVETAR